MQRRPGPCTVARVQARTRVVVLFGGRSAEHDVSRLTAAEVITALDSERFDITALGIDRLGHWWRSDAVAGSDGALALGSERWNAGTLPEGTEVVLPLLHGPLGEDGTVQGLLEVLDVAYVGSGVLASSLCMDKAMTKTVLGRVGIPQVRHHAVRQGHMSGESLREAVADLGFPVFVKPANMGSSVGVTKARDDAEFHAAVAHAWRFDEWILVEEAVTAREIEVAVLGDLTPRASIPGEIVPCHEFYDYEDKYLGGGAELLVPAPLPHDVVAHAQSLALQVFDTLRCSGMARVDFLYEEGGRGLLCSEVNTIPGFTPYSMYPKLWEASGLSYPALLVELIELAEQRHARRRRDTSRS